MRKEQVKVGLRFKTNNTPSDCFHVVDEVDDKFVTYVTIYPNGMTPSTNCPISTFVEYLSRPSIGLETFQFGEYNRLKRNHQNAVLLMRKGGFYYSVGVDALRVADVTGITHTKALGEHLASFPHFALDTYLPKLIRSGYRVAICDDLSL